MDDPGAPSLVLCAGDRFIGSTLLADAARRHLGDIEVRRLDSAWPDTPFGDVDGVREAIGDPGELADAVRGCTALLTHLAPVTRAVLQAGADTLQVVGSVRGGPVNIDLEAAITVGVPVTHLPGRNLSAVAEFTIGSMIAVTRGIAGSSATLARGEWDASAFRFDRVGPELGTCTVGVVGLGAVGARVAQLLHAFGSTVLAHDPWVDAATAARAHAELVDLDTLLARSDVVTLHSRVTPETTGMIGGPQLARMRAGGYLVNTARGELVDHAALRDALDSGHLAGAALDVFDPEPPDPSDPLRRPPVVATPHLAGASRDVALTSADRVARAVADVLAGRPVEHCANPAVLDGR